MPVFVDALRDCVPNPNWKWQQSCHMFAEDLDELHAFAANIGLKRAWFQRTGPNKLPHYDLTAAKRRLAVRRGAVEVNDEVLREFVDRARRGEWADG